MTCFSGKIGRTVAAVALTCLLMFSLAENSRATIIGAQSTGDQLAGGRILVTFVGQGVKSTTIVMGGPGQGTASLAGLFTFSVTGDTFLANWSLINNSSFDSIDTVEFDLSGTISEDPNGNIHTPGVLFDDGTSPSTPDGFAGLKGAVQINVGSPMIFNSFEKTLWADDMNEGDEFVGEVIEYEDFGPLMISFWRDDTDIVGVETQMEVPEPSSAMLMMVATAAAGCLNRRRY